MHLVLLGTQGGIFHQKDPQVVVTSVEKVVEGNDGKVRRDEAVEISSDNSGPSCRSRSEDDTGFGIEADDGDEQRKKRRKKYHRHTVEQIKQMESLVFLSIPIIISFFITSRTIVFRNPLARTNVLHEIHTKISLYETKNNLKI